MEAAQSAVRDSESRHELSLERGRSPRILTLSGAPLQSSAGHVLVFDDITTLVQAQREAAWSEVARRLAHEIKNPLTPIQLSAQRLRKRYESSSDDLGTVLPDATAVIEREVAAFSSWQDATSEWLWEMIDIDYGRRNMIAGIVDDALQFAMPYHRPQEGDYVVIDSPPSAYFIGAATYEEPPVPSECVEMPWCTEVNHLVLWAANMDGTKGGFQLTTNFMEMDVGIFGSWDDVMSCLWP